MPVFGKGRKTRERKKFLSQEVRRKLLPDKKAPARIYSAMENWGNKATSLARIEAKFPGFFGADGFIETRFAETKKPVVVLDWGCGHATAINELGKKMGQKISAYGFSKDAYAQWHSAGHAKLIHATSEGLFRYLKNNSIDLVYSHFGLYHLFKTSKPEAEEYALRLLQKVSKGGKIVFNVPAGFTFKNFKQLSV